MSLHPMGLDYILSDRRPSIPTLGEIVQSIPVAPVSEIVSRMPY